MQARTEQQVRHELRQAIAATSIFACDYCNSPAYERHCKVVCTTCGRVRDCSDLFPQD